MFMSEQEYDRLSRVRQDLQACQTECRRLRAQRDEVEFDAKVALPEAQERFERAEAENRRLREAIVDALADLHPGYVPYSVLKDALEPSDE